MAFKMTKALDRVFTTCKESSLSPKVTALVTHAAQLACGVSMAPEFAKNIGKNAGVTAEELHRVACLCACTAGPKVLDNYATLLKSAEIKSAGIKGLSKLSADRAFQQCTTKTLDAKTTHLVSLAACLASGCSCASGHIVEARNAGATEEEITRAACITACVAGLRTKYNFLAHRESVKGCRACDC
jgi:AhpD family alkylhydroperoxidase